MAKRDEIIGKAIYCIDEVYPENIDENIDAFNIDKFVDEAARQIVRIVPVHALGEGVDFASNEHEHNNDTGEGHILLPEHFVRIILFQMQDWPLPVTSALYQEDIRYRQQCNPVLRGTPYRPAIFVCNKGRALEYYTSMTSEIKEARCFTLNVIDDTYPNELSDITAWKTAELVLTVMNDINAMQLCQAKVNEILQTL